MKYFNILVVEENLVFRDALRDFLSAYKVKFANDCKEVATVTSVNGYVPNLIICDANSELRTNVQHINEFKTNKKWENIPILLLTDQLFFHQVLRAKKNVVTDYFVKPIIKDEILASITKFMKQNRVAKELNNKSFQEKTYSSSI